MSHRLWNVLCGLCRWVCRAVLWLWNSIRKRAEVPQLRTVLDQDPEDREEYRKQTEELRDRYHQQANDAHALRMRVKLEQIRNQMEHEKAGRMKKDAT